MLGRTVGVVAGCALGATAFLLPPDVVTSTSTSTSHPGKAPALPFVSVDTRNQVFELPCPSCAFPARTPQADLASRPEHGGDDDSDDLFWAQGGAYNLILNFTVSDDGRALMMNGRPFYPHEPRSGPRKTKQPDLYIDQIPASLAVEDLEAGDSRRIPLRVTGAITGLTAPQVVSSDGDAAIALDWTLVSLEGRPMTVDMVFIQLLRIQSGDLLILSVDSASPNFPSKDLDFPGPPPSTPGHPVPDDHSAEECNGLPAPLCRMKNFFESKVQGLRHGGFGGCAGRKGERPPNRLPSHNKPHFGPPSPADGPKSHHGRPHHGRPHGPGGHRGHRGHRHGVFHAASKAILAVLIPVMAGVTVGMTVSIIGLLVGRLIGWMWITLVRGGRRGYASVGQHELLEDGEMDKEGASAEELEAPPRYEEAPAYVEVESEQK